MWSFFGEVFQYNWMQFSPDSDKFCRDILNRAETTELMALPSRYMQLILTGKRLFRAPGAVITALLITTLSIGCALVEDYLQFSCPIIALNVAGRILCGIVFLFQFDLRVQIGKRKILMLLYLALLPFTHDSVLIHLAFLMIFNCVFFSNQEGYIN